MSFRGERRLPSQHILPCLSLRRLARKPPLECRELRGLRLGSRILRGAVLDAARFERLAGGGTLLVERLLGFGIVFTELVMQQLRVRDARGTAGSRSDRLLVCELRRRICRISCLLLLEGCKRFMCLSQPRAVLCSPCGRLDGLLPRGSECGSRLLPRGLQG